MYLVERLTWSLRTQTPEERLELKAGTAKSKEEAIQNINSESKSRGTKARINVVPNDTGSFYEANYTYLDVRAAFQEEKRGIITFGFFVAFGFSIFGFYTGIYTTIEIILVGYPYDGGDADVGTYFLGFMQVLLWGDLTISYGSTHGAGSESSSSPNAT
ncbi:MAG: hypothetical protein ACOH2R_05575 [Pseudomonas sp.]